MKKIFIVTGANGHLGGTIVRILSKQPNIFVYGMVLPGVECADSDKVKYYHADVRFPEQMEQMFFDAAGSDVYVIHTAGIVDISGDLSEQMYDVNVGGTKNIVELCVQHKVKRLVYVSSVHAIPEGEPDRVLTETNNFSQDTVTGGYAKTKAEATKAVLAAVSDGLDAVVVHPSGILGPYDSDGNHMVSLVSDYLEGKLPACVRGGYDFVDVRDVAKGCISAALKGEKGQCYILSNRHYEIKDILEMVKRVGGGRKLPCLPVWVVKPFVPVARLFSKINKKPPLYTKYSLYTLGSNDKFSHDKATSELGYKPRDIFITVRDTVRWLRRKKRIARAHP